MVFRNRKRKNQVNIVSVIFLILVVYLAVMLITDLMHPSVNITRVEEGQIINSTSFTGLCIRDEEVVSSGGSGYVSFYIPNGNKVAKGGNTYLLSPTSPDGMAAQREANLTDSESDQVSEKNELPDNILQTNIRSVTELDSLKKIIQFVDEDILAADSAAYSYLENTNTDGLLNVDFGTTRDLISAFLRNYSDSQFSQIYTLKSNLQNFYTEILSEGTISDYNQSTTHTAADGTVMTAQKSGIVCYNYDGYEDIDIAEIDSDVMSGNQLDTHVITPFTYLHTGDPVYKLIGSHRWKIVISLNDNQTEQLAETDSVNLVFKKDDIHTSADFYIQNNGDGNYGVLTLNDYMDRYSSDRYVDIQIVFEEAEGLKIPTSALIKKTFYQVPIQYLVTDDRTDKKGFYVEDTDSDGNKIADFRTNDIYYQDSDYFYISLDDFELGDYIGKVNDDENDRLFRIGATQELDGVYSANRGYTQFSIVKVLHQNADYCIVQRNLDYSISLYDNIILDSSTVTENQIIY